MNELITVCIVDDNETDRLLVIRALDRSPVCRCVGEYTSAADALTEIPRSNPAVVLMDIRLLGMSGIECTRLLKETIPQLKIVMLTALTDSDTIMEASRAGSDGYLTKPFTSNQLLASIEFARASGPGLAGESKRIPCDRRSRFRQAGARSLTARENELLNLLARGLLYKEIEDKMHLSAPMVKKVQHKMFLKLGVSNRTEAVSCWQTRKR